LPRTRFQRIEPFGVFFVFGRRPIMIRKRSWLGVLAIALGLAVTALMGAERSHAVAGDVIDPTCTSLLPCIEYDNNGKGPAVRGVSFNANGVAGSTKKTTSPGAGLFGNDISTSGSGDAGVRGVSVRGTGVEGISSNSVGMDGSDFAAGVEGIANGESGNGVFGVTSPSLTPVATIGVSGFDAAMEGSPECCGTGVSGDSSGGTGVSGQTKDGFAIFAEATGAGNAVTATASSGLGLVVRNSGTGADDAEFLPGSSAGAALIGLSNGEGLEVEGFASSSSTVPAFNATCVHGAPAMTATQKAVTPVSDIMSLDCSGNMILSGSLTQHGTPLVTRRNATGSEVGAYSPQQTTQTMEDVGEAQLMAGHAYVRLAPDFAATIDRQVTYLVFITPQGESRGLYVTQKTPAGFEVRENGNGSSSLAFDYRIVAKPYGELSRRLPMLKPGMPPDPSMLAVIRSIAQAKSQVGSVIERQRERVTRQTAISQLRAQAIKQKLRSVMVAIGTHE
jgi:hypothetical protein